MIEEGVTDGMKLRYVDTYYHFVYKICNIALSQSGTKQLSTVANLGILICTISPRIQFLISLSSSCDYCN